VFKPILFSLLIAAALGGCADPPGLAKPKPYSMEEEGQATAVYQKYSSHLQQLDGVLTTYLTATNNPRELMVVVKDDKTRKIIRDKYGRRVDGMRLSVKVLDSEVADDDGPIEAVPTQTVPDTWWGKVVSFFQGISVPWLPAPRN
jgi:hypothetical protein